ncbi:UNVERIFIED_CONTAM: hypothetical protein GTU68_057505, partial [Idotea baltica]|nr:hypothetical protein [Idotea baltica]
KFYIDGLWVEGNGQSLVDVVNPATEVSIQRVALGSRADVDVAVAAAKSAFESYSQTTKKERVDLLWSVVRQFRRRMGDIADVISQEMGAPLKFALEAQAPAGLGHLMTTLRVLKEFEFEEDLGDARVLREPAGVCGLITPWNWPINQIACKVAPALAAGCTMVLKPSEVAPLNAILFCEVMDKAGVPAGVFNMINGDGATVGEALSTHDDIDLISFTGSTRAGMAVAKNCAAGIKCVALELGGKSANIILDDADFEHVVARDVLAMCGNSGQSCNAGTRMLVPHSRMEETAAIAKTTAERIVVGDPRDDSTMMGPVVSKIQFDRIQTLIEKGISEGAKLEAGGLGRPDGISIGYFVRPTIFSHVLHEMTIAREEIFGPVLSIIGYHDDEDAVRIANDSEYGLSGYISGNSERARAMARRIRTGNVHINGAPVNPSAPFGGYKKSGIGREWGRYGLEEFLETKAILGYHEPQKPGTR